ncbi:MAG: thiamine pyrophosphate-dependent enzyme [Candidatus Cloacimonadaceae bacterium]|nr:thiamine pyrophosphate-dependent enzyme [Candidatus Cloacimonadota bacterium]MCB5254756.1 thiamine pyrophosphate-dependent enzyme [Candidatus Cloacimonadota bacterium]MCK9177883.1 thiamine pyrophosphate-dependent enzyme [Candidatus Cloacimonadota bacterium]MCK9242955.1 thiamine pyrophosphate-dependent enzyme [Candidatus Cloacimonadota bacterium]MDY0127077.1 thiamine pyrophosphate-dependent enzyme [Candidatus Cloacimonadaceae bacterium]
MEKLMLLGDEALAQGALDAGISGFYGYPGTPSTEIIEYVQQSQQAIEHNVHRRWSSNEKTAMETALGMSFAGKRAMVTMKHVGLNVAADPFMNSAMTGAHGGILVAVADDPSMHSSQNEQDSRYYGHFAMMPILEPSNQQECYDMAFYGFELSEKYQIPVMIRLTTRLSHSRSGVQRREVLPQKEMKKLDDLFQFMLLPAIARKKYRKLIEMQKDFMAESLNSPFNLVQLDAKDYSKGIITTGLAYNYLREAFEGKEIPYPTIKVCQYPPPVEKIHQLYEKCDSLYFLEEGMPILEELAKGFGFKGQKPIHGRLDGTLDRDGELNPNKVTAALGLPKKYGKDIPEIVVPRPPALCVGCPHADSFIALNNAIEEYGRGHVFGDIGCYTLGFMPPYNAINSCVDMGASITMAKGAADSGLFPAIAVIGDSTFTHSGMTGLLDCIYDKSNVVVIILDNSTTAMTGGQDYTAFGKLEDICLGLGVEKEHIRSFFPFVKNHEEMTKIYKEEIAYEGVSVIIPRRECVQTMKKKFKAEAKK